MSRYVLGIDFGTLSARGMLYDTSDGLCISSCECEYPHGVISDRLPGSSTPLPPGCALQDPDDYLYALTRVSQGVMSSSGVSPRDVIGVGIDFTSCTLLPVYSDGTPLCRDPRFAGRRHSYVKLWKDHSAQQFADKTNYIFNIRSDILNKYGGKVSSEWALPKIWQTFAEDREIYDSACNFIEAGDWIVWMLCGRQIRNACAAGYKALWDAERGYPDRALLTLLDPGLADLYTTKMNAPVFPVGSPAGKLTGKAAAEMGLEPGTAVAAAAIDGHAMVAGAGISGPGTLLQIMGTSSNQMILSDKLIPVPGICGIVKDGMIRGYYGYEAGQAGFGDHFSWFSENALPYSYKEKVDSEGISGIEYLSRLAAQIKPGGNGLVALDWWNGNRSTLSDGDLTGLIVGMTLKTKPEEIFRALVEATAFGSRVIIENYEKHGITAGRITACGGIAEKNPFIMQTLTDIIGRPVSVCGAENAASLGSAIFAAVAAGKAAGGFDSVGAACAGMCPPEKRVYIPDPDNKPVYDRLYKLYLTLYDGFGSKDGTQSGIMKELIDIRKSREN